MSFSGKVKEELSRQISTARHCQIAEIAAILSVCGQVSISANDKRDRKVKVPSFPKIELHHYTSNILEIGVMEKVIDGFKVKVYDVERCVCDAVKFRNKVGIDVCSEIIDNYLSRPGRNISKLPQIPGAVSSRWWKYRYRLDRNDGTCPQCHECRSRRPCIRCQPHVPLE